MIGRVRRPWICYRPAVEVVDFRQPRFLRLKKNKKSQKVRILVFRFKKN